MSLNATNLYIQASPLPATFQGTPNEFFAEMIKRMRILSPSGTNFIFIGDTEPTSNVGPWLKNGTQWYVWDPVFKQYRPQDITASFTAAFAIGNAIPAATNPTVWLQTTKNATSTNPLDYGNMIRWWTWNGTAWLSPHPVPANSKERKIWVGSEAELWAYDGGDGQDPSLVPPADASGAMWQRDSSFDFKFAVGVGTNATAYDGNPANTITLGMTGGEERVTLSEAELASHAHPTKNDPANSYFASSPFVAGDAVVQVVRNDAAAYNMGFNLTTGDAGSDKSHQNMPPYVGVFFIKRTARIYYVA